MTETNQIVDKKAKPVKKLIKILKKHSGRDWTGSISVRHRGGRQKRYYRIIDFKRDKRDMEAEVVRIEKDPNRNAFIALVKYQDGELRYIIAPEGLKPKDKVIAGEKAPIKTGNALPLKNIPLGLSVHNIELYPKQGGQFVRGAGTSAIVVAKEDKYVHLKLPSGEVRKFLKDCYATIGQVSNITHKEEDLGKAGRKRLLGIRPTVRGTAQNPRSHPHGGGEGRSGEGMHPKTPWGKPARGKKTRKKNKWSDKLIVKKRK
ncbi:MAG: 50S ribosomal protein L2 [Microgenomates group bacterium]